MNRPEHMRAAFIDALGEAGSIRVGDLPVPEPAATEVLVRMEASEGQPRRPLRPLRCLPPPRCPSRSSSAVTSWAPSSPSVRRSRRSARAIGCGATASATTVVRARSPNTSPPRSRDCTVCPMASTPPRRPRCCTRPEPPTSGSFERHDCDRGRRSWSGRPAGPWVLRSSSSPRPWAPASSPGPRPGDDQWVADCGAAIVIDTHAR
jgi:hypothetical protein